MSMCEGWRIWQHNYNPNIRLLVPQHIEKEDLRKILRQMELNKEDTNCLVSIRTPMFSDLDIHEVTYNQTVDAGTFPAKGLLEHYHPESRLIINFGEIAGCETRHGQCYKDSVTGKTQMYDSKEKAWVELGKEE